MKISDKMCPPGVTMYAKCEYFNPLSSVKDRLALAIIQVHGLHVHAAAATAAAPTTLRRAVT